MQQQSMDEYGENAVSCSTADLNESSNGQSASGAIRSLHSLNGAGEMVVSSSFAYSSSSNICLNGESSKQPCAALLNTHSSLSLSAHQRLPSVSSAPELSRLADESASGAVEPANTPGNANNRTDLPSTSKPTKSKRKRSRKSGKRQQQQQQGDASNPQRPAAFAAQRQNSNVSATSGPTAKKRRRLRGRKWKPYAKLTWEERREREIREEKRAEQSRKERFAHGIPVAPYNTTQFIMQDRQARTDHYNRDDVDDIIRNIRAENAVAAMNNQGSSESGGDNISESSGGESEYECEDEFLVKEFSEEYQALQAQRLQEMSKQDLINDYLLLEEKMLKDVREKQTVNEALSERVNQLEAQLQLVTEERDDWKQKCEQLQPTLLTTDWQPMSSVPETEPALME